MDENKNSLNSYQQNISPQEVIDKGILQLDGTYRYKGQVFDENGILLTPTDENQPTKKNKITLEEKASNITKDIKVKKNNHKEKSLSPKLKKIRETIGSIPEIKIKSKIEKNGSLNFPREKLLNLYNKLSDEVKEILESDKTEEKIEDICTHYGIIDKLQEIDKRILYVALGLMKTKDLKQYIKDKVTKNEDNAEKIYREIFRSVFFPIKDQIGAVYATGETKQDIKGKSGPIIGAVNQKKPEIKKEDKYREPI